MVSFNCEKIGVNTCNIPELDFFFFHLFCFHIIYTTLLRNSKLVRVSNQILYLFESNVFMGLLDAMLVFFYNFISSLIIIFVFYFISGFGVISHHFLVREKLRLYNFSCDKNDTKYGSGFVTVCFITATASPTATGSWDSACGTFKYPAGISDNNASY